MVAEEVSARAQVWLREGWLILAKDGPDGLTIDELCRRLGRTKGAFYHHFRDRQHYVAALLSYWQQEMTHRLIALSSADVGDSWARLRRLVALVVAGEQVDLEVSIRAWAVRDPLVYPYQEQVDRLRLEYLQMLYTDITGNERDGRTLAQLAYAVFVGGQHIIPPITGSQLDDLYRTLDQLVLLKWPRN